MSSDAPELFSIKFLPGGVTLSINPACYDKAAEILPQIKEAVRARHVDQPDMAVIENAFTTRAKEPVVFAPPQPEPVDGKVHARLDDEGDVVEIKIEPPMGHGKKAELRDVMEAIKAIGAGDFFLDLEKIEGMLSSFRHRDFLAVGERRNGRLDVTYSKDLTEASLTLTPPFGGEPINVVDIVEYLKNEGVKVGIKTDIIEKMVRDEVFNQAVVVAVGTKAMDGEDASLEFFFDHLAFRAKPTVSEEGEVDFRELNLFQTTRKGEPLVRKIPSNPGIVGLTIFGDEVKPRSGRDVPFPGGLNTTVDNKDNNLIVAAMDGQPKWTGNKVNVVPILEISTDIDFSTGNIDFTGSVMVRGSVISGFTIKAMGDIDIGGSVEMCTIECGGNLNVRQGILGGDRAFVMCRGNITAKFIDKATIYCDGNIFVDESIMFSRVSSSGEILLSGKKGFIMGGTTRASKSVTANRIGTPTQALTIIEVGGSPSLRNELETLENEITMAKEKSDNYSKSIDTSEKRKLEAGGVMNPEQQERVLLMSRERFALMSRLRAFREKKEDLEEKLSRLKSRGLKISARDAVLPGTKISIKTAAAIIQDEARFVTFYERDGEIQMMPFDTPPAE